MLSGTAKVKSTARTSSLEEISFSFSSFEEILWTLLFVEEKIWEEMIKLKKLENFPENINTKLKQFKN